MKRFTLILLAAVLCLTVISCKNNKTSTSNTISKYIPEIESCDEISTGGAGTFDVMKGIGVSTASEEEKQDILSKIINVDISEFEPTEKEEVLGAAISLRIAIEDKVYALTILSDKDNQYIFITNENSEEIFLKGPDNTFPFKDIENLISKINTNKSDTENTFILSVIGNDYEEQLNKGVSADVKGMLDKLLDKSGTVSPASDEDYNLSLSMGKDLIYKINTDTGYFSRNNKEEIMYAKLSENQLEMLIITIGIKH
ncbi:MAG: hypothetical protein CSB16_01775 [Clostridiales bacterium]|nr:MAG: hypothetical protein CSB16_01775 [Clostridiales bacterium]